MSNGSMEFAENPVDLSEKLMEWIVRGRIFTSRAGAHGEIRSTRNLLDNKGNFNIASTSFHPPDIRHRLIRFDAMTSYWNVRELYDNAGYLELLAYLEAVTLPIGTRIVALGAYIDDDQDIGLPSPLTGPSYLIAHKKRDDYTEIDVGRNHDFDPDYFFLVRTAR